MNQSIRNLAAIKISVLILAVLVGCDGEPVYRERIKTTNDCRPGSSEKRASFILQCIESGNPKSDEEPEDWIGMCQEMAENTLCGKRYYEVTEKEMNGWWKEISRRPVAVSEGPGNE